MSFTDKPESLLQRGATHRNWRLDTVQICWVHATMTTVQINNVINESSQETKKGRSAFLKWSCMRCSQCVAYIQQLAPRLCTNHMLYHSPSRILKALYGSMLSTRPPEFTDQNQNYTSQNSTAIILWHLLWILGRLWIKAAVEQLCEVKQSSAVQCQWFDFLM